MPAPSPVFFSEPLAPHNRGLARTAILVVVDETCFSRHASSKFFMAAFCLLVAAKPAIGSFAIVLALGALAGWVYYAKQTWKLGGEWIVVILCGICWILGALFYFYMPLAGMSNPPMQWGYPRTVEGFVHAFTRGQYEKTNPTNIIGDPMRFITQLMMLGRGIVEEFNWLYAFLALVPFLFLRRLQRREQAWIIGLTAIYLCLGVLLMTGAAPCAFGEPFTCRGTFRRLGWRGVGLLAKGLALRVAARLLWPAERGLAPAPLAQLLQEPEEPRVAVRELLPLQEPEQQ